MSQYFQLPVDNNVYWNDSRLSGFQWTSTPVVSHMRIEGHRSSAGIQSMAFTARRKRIAAGAKLHRPSCWHCGVGFEQTATFIAFQQYAVST